MKRSLFNVRLYLDGIRQLRIIGILFTVLISLVTAVIPIMHYLDSLNWQDVSPSGIDFLEMNPLIILLFCAVAPLMTLYLFTFLNKRSSSDFYHAIPNNRECLFFSFFAAVMTWVLGILAFSAAVSLVCYGAFPQLYIINYTSVLLAGFNAFAGALFIAAAVAIAMSVTGTVFTNLLVALILISFPRLLLELVLSGIQSAFPLVNGLNFIPLLSSQYNVPVGFVFSIFISGEFNGGMTQWQSGIYTLVAGLVYMVLAAVLFVKRRSEGAGQSAPSRRLQSVYRFLVGFVISCVATYGLFEQTMDDYSYLDESDLFSFALIYLIAVLAALTFEVLCTRKFRGLLRKGITTILLLVAANLVFFFGMLGAGRSLYAYTPDAEEIDSVSFTTGMEDSYLSYYDGRRLNYFTAQTGKIKLDDPEILKIVSRQLEYSVDLLEISRNRFNKESSEAQTVTVAIRDGLFTRHRHVLMYSQDINALSKRLQEVPDYRKVYETLPERISSVDFESMNKYMYVSAHKEEDVTAFYEVFKREFLALDFETRYTLLQSGDYDEESVLTVNIRLVENGQWYYINVPLYLDTMPETIEWYVNYSNQDQNAKAGLDILSADFDEIEELSVTLYDKENDRIVENTWYFPKLTDEQVGLFKTWITELAASDATTAVDTDKPFYYVAGYVRRTDEYDSTYYYSEANYGFVQGSANEVPAWLETLLTASSQPLSD